MSTSPFAISEWSRDMKPQLNMDKIARGLGAERTERSPPPPVDRIADVEEFA